MANPFWTLEDANLFCGSQPDDGGASNHLILTEMKLPAIDQQYADHRATGASVSVEINTVIARLEVPFVMLGMTPQVMALIASWVQQQNWFTAYGVIRDQVTGEAAQAAAVLQGQLGRADPQNFRRGDVMHTNYSIRKIIHYELQIAGNQLYLWDFPTNTLVVNGVDRNLVINNFLVTGATTAQPVLSGSSGFVPGT